MRRRILRLLEPIAALCMSSDVARCGRSVRSPVDPRAAASDARHRPLANPQDRFRRQRDKLARNRDSGTAKSRAACASTYFPMDFARDASIFAALTGGLRRRSVPRDAAQLIHGVNRLRAGIACAAKRHAHSLQLSFPLLPTLTSHWYFRCQENFICLVLCLRPGHRPGCDGC